MKIALVTPEIAPFSRTGGLGEVMGALPAALAKEGGDVVTVSPLYRGVRERGVEPTRLRVRVPVGDTTVDGAVFRSGTSYFLEHDPYFDRDALYGSPLGDYSDNVSRFIFLCRGALELIRQLGVPDVLHCHDWQTGLVPIYLKTLYARAFGKSRSVFTIHNLSYQGLFWHLDMPLTGLAWKHYNWHELEFHDRLCFMKGALVYADALTTVSPTYAREIQGEEFGCGMDGVLRERAGALRGILHGLDPADWNPETDPHVEEPYSAEDPSGKARCKSALQKRCGLPERPEVPMIGLIGGLSADKGTDLFLSALDVLGDEPIQFVVLGAGRRRLQNALLSKAEGRRDRLSVNLAYDHAFFRQVVSGCDLLLDPSRVEPSGASSRIGLRYGTVPIVRATGGLADTVEEGASGFTFRGASAEGLADAARRALRARENKRGWSRIVRAGMEQDFSWTLTARRYMDLYRSLKSRNGNSRPQLPPP